MSGAVTHDVAQYLYALIRPFLNTEYKVKSSHEFLTHKKNLNINDDRKIVSLDVEVLFTNAPVDRTIASKIEYADSHPTLASPELSEDDLHTLLDICKRKKLHSSINHKFTHRLKELQ